MTAKEYLSRYRYINLNIGSKVEQRKRLLELATCVSPSNGGSSGKAADRVGNVVSKIADLEAEINEQIDKLVDTKREIEETISQVQNERLRLILTERYINGKRWEVIAVAHNIELRWLYRLHGKALKEVSKIIADIDH
ncbi:MAG: DUF1492 domain-containing protein [Ruminiclostridium sp.]